MELTTENIELVIKDCLFKNGEDTTEHVIGEGVMTKMGFHPGRLKAHEENIFSMLKGLPEEFMATKGGGYTFLNACVTKDGDQWTGDHSSVDKLIVLGSAIKRMSFLMPRDMWDALPGGMPYLVVKDN